ncbi:lantibiotic dehydratase [Spirillospora sp. CA-128828]|uniref:lantibiotic dehydratase n=1 Tax=Spirillospora sp. CA-128828 TaxID=3240033 RepID=UPI003D89BA92
MYQPLDAIVIRASALSEHEFTTWPDLTGPDAASSWRPWLQAVMAQQDFAAAVRQSSPDLARRVEDICAGKQVAEPAARRAVLAITRYLLRAQGRATPFGLFAGVAATRIATRSQVAFATGHQAVGKADASWLAAVIDRLEADPALLTRLRVVANNLLIERDGDLLLTHRPATGPAGAPTQVRVRATPPVRAALQAASAPILFADLAAALAASSPGVPAPVIAQLLSGLVAQRLLITSLRPPMTVTDPLGHLVAELDAAAAVDLPGPSTAVTALRDVQDALTSTGQTGHLLQRAELAASPLDLSPGTGSRVAVDLRMEMTVTVPPQVAAEAARAASVLARLASRADRGAGWAAWHAEFLERYGPHALVPVLDAVDANVGLGFPAGFLTASDEPAPELTRRDHVLLAVAQNAAARHTHEIVLDDTLIADVADIDADTAAQPSTELTVRVHAPNRQALDSGEFTLSVTGVSRNAGTTTGRFLHLLPDLDRIREAYARAPTTTGGALRAQLSAPPLYPATENVARSPRLLPVLLPLGEHHPAGDGLIDLDDLAVTADATRLWLVSRLRRRPVEPVAFTAVEPTRQTHPLARFLLEVPHALTTPCAGFDWGAAAHLPFLPALRSGRTLLSPARWLLADADLPGPTASPAQWEQSLAAWRRQTGLPARLYAGDGDQRLPLDLAEGAHRAVLRSLLKPGSSLALRAAPNPDSNGWIDGRTHEIVIPLASTRPAGPPPPLPPQPWVPGRDHGHLPGRPGRLYLKLYGHPDQQDTLLIRHLPHLTEHLDDTIPWWFLRYRDPHPHLRLRLTTPAAASTDTARLLADWTSGLRKAGLVGRVQWDTYFPEEGRFGTGPAFGAAETCFAADSAAVLAQLTTAHTSGLDARALIAASMLDLATGLLGDGNQARRWLIAHARTTSTAPARPLYQQAVAHASPDQETVAALPGGDQILACWKLRRDGLAAYREILTATGARPVADLLPDLLHLHHARAAGPDRDNELACLHLARAAALSWTARTMEPR